MISSETYKNYNVLVELVVWHGLLQSVWSPPASLFKHAPLLLLTVLRLLISICSWSRHWL